MGGWTPVVEPTSAWTPVDESAQTPSTYSKLTTGYNPGVEDWAQQHPTVGPIVRFLDAAGGAAMKSPEMLKDAIVGAIKPPVDENGNVDWKSVAKKSVDPGGLLPSWDSVKEAVKVWSDPATRKAALSLLPEALGQGTGTVAGAEATGKVAGAAGAKTSEALSNARPAMREALFTPEGKQTPLAKAVTHPVDTAADYALRKITGAPEPELKGASVPITSSPNYPALQAARRAAMKEASVKLAQSQESASPASASQSSVRTIQEPSSPSGASIENEGRPATWTNQTVLQRASQGDMVAIQQARLRALPMPENTNFVGNKAATITPSAGAPRSVTIFDAQGNPVSPTPPQLQGGPAAFNKLTLSDGEDLGPGMGTDHIIRDRSGNRVGSVQIEDKGAGTVHVHWLGGEFGPNARGPLMDAIKEQYPGTEKITYDRRRLAKGASAATTEPREMQLP